MPVLSILLLQILSYVITLGGFYIGNYKSCYTISAAFQAGEKKGKANCTIRKTGMKLLYV